MSYHRPSAKKLRFIENAILVTFPIVLFAGCAGSDVKPESKNQALAVDANYTQLLHETKATDTAMAQLIDTVENSEVIVANNEEAAMPAGNKSPAPTPTETYRKVTILADNKPAPAPSASKLLFFDTDKYQLNDEQRKEIKRYADFLIANPDTTLTINGHADIRGTEQYNQSLSEKRAQTVYELLTGFGVAKNQLHAKAFGELHPLHNINNWDENRRVLLEISDPMMMSSN